MDSEKKYIAIEAEAKDWEDALTICGAALISNECVGKDFVTACIEREKEFPTGLPTTIPVAIPHAASNEVKITSVCVLKLKNPIVFNRMDDSSQTVAVKIVFNLAIKGSNEHIEFLQKLIAFVMNEEKVQKCLDLSVTDIPAYLETTII